MDGCEGQLSRYGGGCGCPVIPEWGFLYDFQENLGVMQHFSLVAAPRASADPTPTWTLALNSTRQKRRIHEELDGLADAASGQRYTHGTRSLDPLSRSCRVSIPHGE